MKIKLLVATMLILAALAMLIGCGLLGALLEHVGVWVYGWKPTGVGYLGGLVFGFFCVCLIGSSGCDY